MSEKKVIKPRCDTNVWLIGHQLPVLDKLNYSNSFPIVDLVIRHLLWLKNKKLSGSCSNTFNEAIQIWFVANFPTSLKRSAVKLLTSYLMRPMQIVIDF